MDLGTIKTKLEASVAASGLPSPSTAHLGMPPLPTNIRNSNPENGKMVKPEYKHPDDMILDVRLVFKNAMKFNSPGSDVYVMAQTVWDKFEERWRAAVLPRVEEARQHRTRHVESLRSSSEKKRRIERVNLVSQELRACEATMKRTRTAGDDLRVLMSMMMARMEEGSDSARNRRDNVTGVSNREILQDKKITRDDIEEIRVALKKLSADKNGLMVQSTVDKEPDTVIEDVARKDTDDKMKGENVDGGVENRKEILQTVIRILEEESDELSREHIMSGNANMKQTVSPSSTVISVKFFQKLTVELDNLDSLSLRRLQRALRLGRYSNTLISANDNQELKEKPSVFRSRIESSRQRHEQRIQMQRTAEDDILDV